MFFALFETLNWAVVLDDAIDGVLVHGDGAKWWRHDEQDVYSYMVCRDRRVAFTLTDLEPIFQSGINQLAEQRRWD